MNPKFLDPPRWPGGPQICIVANLPAFETEAQAIKFNSSDHPLPVLARWQCKACEGWHYWSTLHTDSNGAFKAGAGVLPPRIAKMALGWKGA